jgi:hypothetical protein
VDQKGKIDMISKQSLTTLITPCAFLSSLSKAELRFYNLLAICGESETWVVRHQASVGNCSDVAATFNKKAAAHKDPRRIRCEKRPFVNRFGDPIRVGVWFLEVLSQPLIAANDASADDTVDQNPAA